MAGRYRFDEVFKKEQTVIVTVNDTKVIEPEDIIDEIERKCGKGSVMACVPKNGVAYEVVVSERRMVGELNEELNIKGESYQVKELTSRMKIVSIINLSMYVTDDEIVDRFDRIGVEIISPIRKHKMNSRANVYDGTRVFKVVLPPTLASIPYSMKFSVNEKENAFYRVIHNDQIKVCSGCFSADHIYKNCPDFKCFKCQEQGHIGKHCPKNVCEVCSFRKPNCECRKRRHWGQGFSADTKRHERENSRRGSAEYRRSEHDKEENGDKQDELIRSTKIDKVEKPTEKDDQTQEQMQEDDDKLDLDDSNNDCKSFVEIDVHNEIEKNVNNEIEKVMNNEIEKVINNEIEKDVNDEIETDINNEMYTDKDVQNDRNNEKKRKIENDETKSNVKKDHNNVNDNQNKENEDELCENINNSNQLDNTEMSDTNTDDISSLEQSDSQRSDDEMNEGECGTLDDITISDSLWVDINSQGEQVNETPGKTDTFKIVRRRGTKIVPNYKAAKAAHFLKKNKNVQ